MYVKIHVCCSVFILKGIPLVENLNSIFFKLLYFLEGGLNYYLILLLKFNNPNKKYTIITIGLCHSAHKGEVDKIHKIVKLNVSGC